MPRSTAECSPFSPTSESASAMRGPPSPLTDRSTGPSAESPHMHGPGVAAEVLLGVVEEGPPHEVGVLRLAVDGQVVAVTGEISRDERQVLHGAAVVVAVGDGRAAGGEFAVVVVEDAL